MIDISRHPTDIFIDMLRSANPNLPPLTKDDISTRNLVTTLPPTTTEVDVDLLIDPSEVDGDYVTFEYDRIDVDHLFSLIDQDGQVAGAQRRYSTDYQDVFAGALGLPAVSQDLHLHLLTKFGLNVGDEAKVVAHTEPDSYQLQFNGLVYTGNIEFLPDYRMVNPSDLIVDGYRFSHNTSGLFPAIASELTGFQYDAVNNQITYDANPSSYVGIVSAKLGTHYTFKTLIKSGGNGGLPVDVVAMFAMDAQGNEHVLSVRVDVSEGVVDGPEWGIRYNPLQANTALLDIKYSTTGPYNWDGISGREVTVTRAGNTLSVTGAVLGTDPGTPYSFTIDLTSDPLLAPFLDGSRFGYAVSGSPLTSWKNIPL
jgi:hypothetical protein